MSHTGLPHDAVFYPTSDGQPMAETPVHGDCMMYVTSALRWWFEKHGREDVYVGMNNFLYYERCNPRAVVAPDVFVVVGAPASPPRDSYLLWNEPKGPDFVLEVTSKSTRGTDEQRKREVYASLGVSEYFLYDPRAEYLAPPLQGFRLHEGEYRALRAVTVLSNRGVAVASQVLGLELRDEREARRVRLHDPVSGDEPSLPPGIGAGSRGRGHRTPGRGRGAPRGRSAHCGAGGARARSGEDTGDAGATASAVDG